MLLESELPGLIQHNRERGGSELWSRNDTAKHFFDNQGPELVEVHVPWLVDLLPPANWVYIVMVVSLLFNVMGVGHRFRLWRIDANRVRVDEEVRRALGGSLTPEEIHDMPPADEHKNEKVLSLVDGSIGELAELRDRCRKQSLSMLVPMGQEMGYRYQEDQIDEALTALRLFRERLVAALDAERSHSGRRRSDDQGNRGQNGV